MDFRSAGDRVRSLIAAKKPRDLAKSALTSDSLRDNIINEAAATSDRFRSHIRKRPEVTYNKTDADGNVTNETFEWTTYGEAVKDIARAGYSYDEPEIASRDKVRPSHLLNREVMANMLASEEFQQARPYTRNNELESLFGAMAASHSLEEAASGVLAEHVARSQEMDEAEGEAQTAEEMLESLRRRAKAEIDAAGEVSDKTKREIKGQTKARQAARERLQQLIHEHLSSNFVDAAAQAAAKAAAEHKDAVEAAGMLPGVGGGMPHNLSPDQQLALAEKWANNHDLREIARMLGRMIRDMKFKRQARTKNVKVEPVGITTGRDLDIMLPHELARAYMPETKPLWAMDYSERKLLTWEMSGKSPAGKGPIVEVHDGSGSMSGEKFVWASSLALTLLTLAQREKRAFAGVEFGSRGQLKSWFFPARQTPDPNEVLDFASHFYAGGTSTVTGMREALRIIREQPEFKTADVILIGDGQDHFKPDDLRIRDELRALGVRIHGISILCPNNAYMSQMCEYTVDVLELAGSNNATDTLAENLT